MNEMGMRTDPALVLVSDGPPCDRGTIIFSTKTSENSWKPKCFSGIRFTF